MPIGTAAVLGGAAISGLLGGAFSALSGKKQLQAVRETNEANRELAILQNQWNLEQWQREADWQSTPHQLQMWKDAGLNPNFFNGGTVAPTTQSADLANQVAPDVASPYMHIGDSIQRGFDQGINGLLQVYQMKKLQQETTNLGTQNEQIQAMTKKLLSDVGLNEFLGRKYESEREFIEKQMSGLDTQFSLWKAQANQANASSRQINLHNRLMLETWDDQKLAYKLENSLTKAKIGLSSAQVKMLTQQFKTEVFHTALKANEFSMLDFNNWLTKVVGTADAFQKMSDNEKSEVMGEIFASVRSVLQTLNTSYSDKVESLKRYGFREQLREKAESWMNP